MIGISSLFILHKQQLILHSSSGTLSELLVVGNATVILSVILGMFATYAMIFLVAVLISFGFFSDSLLTQWISALQHESISAVDRLIAAGFFAALSQAVGSLGASLEGQQYVAYSVYADAEL